ncbi:MAG: DUF2480 family protein [Chitinophagales bacterium]|nr:DUF2480 family protein [Chitinophagales bacterium]
MSLLNKVAESGIITINLEDYLSQQEIVVFDMKPFLFKELILKEKEFRTQLKEHNWTQYQDKTVAVFCSTDAIIPKWAYMLVAQYLIKVTPQIYFDTKESLEQKLLLQNIQSINATNFIDERIVIKGCGNNKVKEAAFIEISKKLIPVVKSLFFGEACSTVPIYKKK